MKKVFIANVMENDAFAISLHKFLNEQKIKCFQYKIDLLPGENITQETKSEIENSDHCIICFSKELNDREKTDMHREIYTAIAEAYQRKPNSKFLIPVKINECTIEDFPINSTTSMRDLWYADFNENSEKARQDLLTAILGSGQEDPAAKTEDSFEYELISLRRYNQPSLKFLGNFIGESTNNRGWNIQIYETAESVKECNYVIYVDYTNTEVIVSERYTVKKYVTLESVIEDIYKIARDIECATDLLEILGMDVSEYLE